jgi:cell division protein FtsN
VVLGILVITIGALLWHASSPWRAAHAEKERIAKAMAARAAMEASPSQLGNTLPPPPPSATPVVSAPPQFDFYKILPAKTTADRPVLNITGPVSQTGYLIQVGVFSTQDAANVIKAKLLMLGYSPSVAMVPGGAYSVTLGPIVTQNGASMIVRKLRSEGFQDINVKYLN